MPFIVKELLEGRQEPVTVRPDETVHRALELMIEHDYSQLPVVDKDNRPQGMITSDSIVRALNHFAVTPDALRVSDAMKRAESTYADEDLFDLLDNLRDNYAILIVDSDERLTGIVTSYDATEYFRRRSQDIMFVEDIETMLRDLIRAAFTNESGQLDESSLAGAVSSIGPSADRELRGRFQNALAHYLQQGDGERPILDRERLAEAFTTHLEQKTQPKQFEDLTLQEYIDLFLDKGRWSFFSGTFSLEPGAIRRLLEPVRETRNALAHFQGELTAMQREQLLFCKEWLARHRVSAMTQLSSQDSVPVEPLVDKRHGQEGSSADVTAVQSFLASQALSPTDSRYLRLASYLQGQDSRHDAVQLTLERIEQIIDAPLPASAREHRSWWANDSSSHVQSRHWLSAGWRVATADLAAGVVTFVRVQERTTAYDMFFTAFRNDLQAVAMFPLRDEPVAGRSYVRLANLPSDELPVGSLFFSFSPNNRVTIGALVSELPEQESKQSFDALASRKLEVETRYGASLKWTYIDHLDRWGVTTYHEGSINADEEHLATLREWAVQATIRFHAAFVPVFRQVLADLGISRESLRQRSES